MPELGGVLHVAGRSAAGTDIGEHRFLPDSPLPPLARPVSAWDGSNVARADSVPLLDAAQLAAQLRHDCVFVAHRRALPIGATNALAGRTVWTTGTKSWFALAAQGVWVQGCSEGMGAEAAARLIAEPLLRLPPPARWDVLTHAAASESWQEDSWAGAHVIGTYAVSDAWPREDAQLTAATHIYWSSTAQFERGWHLANSRAHHASGPGKTAAHIRRAGVRNFHAFPSAEEWRKWTAKGP
jgi:hypothetical protein